ncbi:MAG: UDP-N-acetylglucosamine--LPS N-acetylglucosamine transferase [Candidatus Thiodiazotropha sp. (ex. Lucinisca nassula)]|nr:UDP-N-acetylglucosamine--LPS N-acetylglucosamine transferase [Candidatus Thiodiazotropha sp. (ex. Lucinisca nassula)]
MKQKKLLAVASAGGHWVQLLRMRPAFEFLSLHWISTSPGVASQVDHDEFTSVRDANMWDKLGLVLMATQIAWRVLLYRPDIVVTTGAAPGYFAIVFARLLGAKTIWIDSIANAEEMSLAGKKARRWATHWITQWPELSGDDGPTYIGSVL